MNEPADIAMKLREVRRRVLIPARMRVGVSWGDVSILDISSRGMLIQAIQAPPRGTYLEVRRGRHVIVARVVWTQDRKFGIFTQDRLSVEAIISEPDRSAPEARRPCDDAPPVERRVQQSSGDRHERSRAAARVIEFGVLGFVAASAAAAGYELVSGALQRPLVEAAGALAKGPGSLQ